MDEQESTFDLAALEEGQEPLEEGPLPLPGFPAPPMPAEDAPPGEWDGPPRPEERASASDSESSDGQLSLAIGQRGAVEAQPPRPVPDAPPAPPPIVEVEVVQEPVDLEGLSTSEVADRVERGAVNIEETEERTNWDIVRDNSLTFFNMVLFSLISALFVLAIVEQEIGFSCSRAR